MKALLHPIPRIVIAVIFFGIALLDGSMRHCEQDYYACCSFIGKISIWIFCAVLASFVIQNMLWPALKWVWSKLMGAVTL